MSPSRIVRVGKKQQVITTKWVEGTRPGFTERHEHVTLETPKPISATQRLRMMTAAEAAATWRKS